MENNCCNEPIVELTDEEKEQQLEFDFLVNKETNAEQRLSICKECPELKSLNRCKLCGCFMNIKVRLYKSSCPAGKW